MNLRLTRHRLRLLYFMQSALLILTKVVAGDGATLCLLICEQHVLAGAHEQSVHGAETHALKLDHLHLCVEELLLNVHARLHARESLELRGLCFMAIYNSHCILVLEALYLLLTRIAFQN